MKAIHSLWTRPMLREGKLQMEDFDILSTILSALKWREKNGEIFLVTDAVGYKFYKKRGLLSMWDNVSTELDEIPESINPEVFWAAGKIFALKNATSPVAVIDTDFIVWDRLAFSNMPELTVIHQEAVTPEVYPDINTFQMKAGYVFNPELDWGVNPYNTAFYVIKDEGLRELYTREAISFMENCQGTDPLWNMVFCEQRLLAMCGKMYNADTLCLSDMQRLFADGERYFTHLWGMKQQMRDDDSLRFDFCMRCINRIERDFPEYGELMRKIPELKRYF